ncbi:HAMP domain-containing histidine kinase [Weissella diestrammenae]|uniref:histidine kinase n=1 Tax=Weissella diestrammenae TaxID=1162633 RepID=A0A7G9T6D7_9LACO|nr:HAMP domain-containing sensor histidine kinase [Weissella diestrammenae]MCM0583291.1 HAMP domain-containing histidine kinase [Weissella diestrammenae]QNN75662.1 HAMP domain-containing histidine kinase [Weissella diestrammenae]
MKMMYQQMLAFFTVIMAALLIIGVLFTQFTTKMVEDNTYRQLNRFSVAIAEEAMRYKADTGDFAYFDTRGLDIDLSLLEEQNMSFTVYDGDENVVYPTATKAVHSNITASQWRKLKNHKIVHTRVDAANKANKEESNTMGVMKPFFDNKNRLIAVVVTRANVSTVDDNMDMLRKNLAIAFLVAGIVAVMLSFIVSQLIVNRLRLIQLVTRQVASGDYQAIVDTTANDEIGALAEDVNTMTNALNEQEHEIKRQEERRKEFMANASHEMRTPLTTISGIVEGLQYDVIPEDEKMHSYDMIKNEADRLTRLVKDNLDYERLRQNKVVLNKTNFDLLPIINNLVEQLSGKADVAGDVIKIVNVKSTPVMIFADQDRLIQIIFNIINNAIQFTENGEIKIRAWREAHAAVFSVSDSGIGMTPEQVQNIWERYYKADESRTVKGESGLGMAIIRQLIDVHQGTISVQSEFGKGSTFTVRIPDEQ